MNSTLATTCLALASILSPTLSAADPGDLIKIDLVRGWETPEGTQMAGLRIRVADGWKTYWRSPGDAGVPPRFDWSGSENLHGVRLHWPRPQVFDSFGQRTLGYAGEIVLPVELVPVDPSLPMTLSGQAELGVCSDICVAVSEPYSDSTTDGTREIRAGLAAQPTRQPAGAAICEVTPISDGLRLSATLSLSDQGGPEVTIVELMQGDIWVSEAISERHGGNLTTTADLVPPQAAPFALDRSLVRITVLGQNGAAEALGCQGS